VSNTKIRLILADDHALFRQILIDILASWRRAEVVAQASNAEELLDVIERIEADVLVLDISMPGAKGTSLVRSVHQRMPDLAILVLSMHDEIVLVKDAFRSGARGYITKGAGPGELEQAITAVADGEQFLSPALRDSLHPPEDVQADREERLTQRESQILHMLVDEGLPLVKVATLLGLSPKTITTHKANIMAKLGVTSNAELMQYVVSRSLTPDDPELAPTRG
jgi:DNA-binding NarL/FixJ family response regulator